MSLAKFFLLALFQLFLVYSQNNFHFNQDHKFTILQITDMHYGEALENDIGNNKNLRFYLQEIKPDLVVITGDLVSGYAWDLQDQNFFQNIWSNFSKVFNDTQIHFAYTLGNHDHQGNLDKEHIAKLAMNTPYSLMNASQELNWASVYNIPIFSNFNKSALATNLWLFDSGDQYMFHLSWGKITNDQMRYFKKKNQELRKDYGNIPHSIAFFHIPIPEFNDLWNDLPVYGDKYEKVCCPLFNHGTIFNEFLEENVTGVFCGHDHNNFYGGLNKGIELVYGRKTGLGSYGPPENVTRGVRVITLSEKLNKNTNEILIEREHYIFDEEGEVTHNGPSFIRGYEYQYICDPSFDFSTLLPDLDHYGWVLIPILIYLVWRLIKGLFN